MSRQALRRMYREVHPHCDRILRALEDDLRRHLSRLALHAGLKTRVKTFASYYRKYIRRVGDPGDPDAERTMGDLLGMRVICPFLEDVAKVEAMIRRSFAVDEVERKGEDAPPEDFGYQSTHLLIRIPAKLRGCAGASGPRYCEIQVRTTLQDAWAEVEHELLYKAGPSPFHEPLKRKLAALNANLTLADMVFQEVRDYQRELHEALSTRRAAFHEKVRRGGRERSGALKRRRDRGSPPQGRHGMDGIEALLLEGLQAHNARSYVKATRIYTRILDMGPGDAMRSILHVHRGMAYFARSMHRRALEDFLTALAIDPDHAASCYYAGAVYEMMGDPKRALSFFNRSLAADPARIDSLVGRARILFRGGDPARALRDCEEALALDPASKDALAWKRRIQAAAGGADGRDRG